MTDLTKLSDEDLITNFASIIRYLFWDWCSDDHQKYWKDKKILYKQELLRRLALVPKWRPIEEAPKNKYLLISYLNDNNHPIIIKAIFVTKFTEESDPDFTNLTLDYDPEKDTYYFPQGWYERVYNWEDYSHILIDFVPTHFMELPEPPKERDNDHN